MRPAEDELGVAAAHPVAAGHAGASALLGLDRAGVAVVLEVVAAKFPVARYFPDVDLRLDVRGERPAARVDRWPDVPDEQQGAPVDQCRDVPGEHRAAQGDRCLVAPVERYRDVQVGLQGGQAGQCRDGQGGRPDGQGDQRRDDPAARHPAVELRDGPADASLVGARATRAD